MLGIILLILKIIGIVLLCILGLILVLVLIVLFAPIHYRVCADYHEKLFAEVRITWLLRIISGRLRYQDGELRIKARALWFPLYDNQKNGTDKEKSHGKHRKTDDEERTVFDQQEKAEKAVKQGTEEKGVNQEAAQDYFDEESVKQGRKHTPELDSEIRQQTDQVRATSEGESDTESDVDAESDEKPNLEDVPKKTFFQKARDWLAGISKKIISFVKSIFSTIRAVIRKAEGAKEQATEKLHQVNDMIHDPQNRELAAFIKTQVCKLFKIIKPRKYHVNLHYGFDDPEMTGKLAMWLAVAYGFLGMNLNIQPDFEQEILEGDMELKGYVQLYGLIMIAIKCYTNKQIRKFMNK